MGHISLSKSLSLAALTVILSGCFNEEVPSHELTSYLAKNPAVRHEGQVRFTMDSLGSLSAAGLFHQNIVPLKLYGTALLLVDRQKNGGELDGDRLPEVMERYGFLRPRRIENWRDDLAPEPKIETNLGFVHATIDRTIINKRYRIEVANITCAACHSGVTYDAQGNPTGNAWLGQGNSSLNFDGWLGDIYKGLKLGMKDQALFMRQIREAYPRMDAAEDRTIEKELLPQVAKELRRLAKMDRVLPFPNGGPGLTNGVGAFKRNAKLLKDAYSYDAGEAGFVSIPTIADRGFRSSLTYDGVYGVPGEPRYRTIRADQAREPSHHARLAEMAAFFTYSAMGNEIDNIEPNIPSVKTIWGFVGSMRTPKYPGVIDADLARAGQVVYQKSCASCHGTYDDSLTDPRLVSFPNRLVPQALMGTDPLRWSRIDQGVQNFTRRTVFNKYTDAGKQLGGYVAPVLSGLWATAPYLHNGSVPTLWHLMHPEKRPTRFQYGGHSLDLEKVGLKGELNEKGEYLYPKDAKPWAITSVFDSRETGRSNKGHVKEFESLTEDEKSRLLEYLKLL